jgi:excisionase family DNA binding protein
MKLMDENRELITAAEASKLSGLARPTLYRLGREGRLRSFRVLGSSIRFDRADVLALAEERGASYDHDGEDADGHAEPDDEEADV